jgi:tetratricopeptide (TPR) repeat protein
LVAARYLTLVWPGLPWLWLRGSLLGLVLALAFAVAVDVCVLTTWIWTGLVDPPLAIAIWAGTAAIWVLATVSALGHFPVPLGSGREAEADALFVRGRDAYLARDWTAAEAALHELLAIAPTDGEAQLLLATLLRRVGRLAEARSALKKLSASDSGRPWGAAITRELARVAEADGAAANADAAATLPLRGDPPAAVSEKKAA